LPPLSTLIPYTTLFRSSESWFSWNPSQPTDPVDSFLRGPHPPTDAVVVQANWSDNPWLPEELRRDLEDDRRRDPDKFEHIWGGRSEEHTSELQSRENLV